ncbi:unnamed protein product, partial [Ectocarpus fasciculatus]
MKVIAESGQKVVGAMRSNSRENVTVVVTISAAGATLAPWIIYKGQRLQADWVKGRNGPPNARLAVTDSSFMQGTVFVNYIRDFHRQLLDRGLINGTPHVLVLDGHASHVTYEVIKLARDLNIVLYQIPSHSSHVVQPLDVGSFGSFKREITKVLSAFPARNGGRVPAKSDMLGILGDAWLRSFSEQQNISSFAGAGLWPVDGERAMGRLQGVGKRKERSGARPPVEDITVAISDKNLADNLGPRTVRELQQKGQCVKGI